jgi:glutamine amidotransferase PdxT
MLEIKQEEHEKDSKEWAKLEAMIIQRRKQLFSLEFMILNGGEND